MHVKMKYEEGAFMIEKSGDISEMSILAILGYREARNWALAPDNLETILPYLTPKGVSPPVYYIEFSLFETFCKSVWGHSPPEDPEFTIGFCIGVDEAVRELIRRKLN